MVPVHCLSCLSVDKQGWHYHGNYVACICGNSIYDTQITIQKLPFGVYEFPRRIFSAAKRSCSWRRALTWSRARMPNQNKPEAIRFCMKNRFESKKQHSFQPWQKKQTEENTWHGGSSECDCFILASQL